MCARAGPGACPSCFRVKCRSSPGYLLPPEFPGLGIEIDEDAAAAYPPIDARRLPAPAPHRQLLHQLVVNRFPLP